MANSQNNAALPADRKPAETKGGVRSDDDMAVAPLTTDDDDEADDRAQRQEELLDEGIEETFPASDPVSVKHIT